jgi:uncharacterized membrane protein required for colicin V production
VIVTLAAALPIAVIAYYAVERIGMKIGDLVIARGLAGTRRPVGSTFGA